MSLPRNWASTRLGELLPLTYGKSLIETARDTRGVIPVYGSSGVLGTHSNALATGETLIVGRKGNVGAVHHSSGQSWVIDTAYYVDPKIRVNWKFFYYLLQHLQLGKLDRSTAIPGLSRDDYNKVEITIAPAAEQNRIVAEIEKQFTRLDDAVAALKRVQANLKRYRASVLKAACEGRLVPTEAELARKEGRDYEPASELLRRILAQRRAKWETDQLQKMIAAGRPPKSGEWRKRYIEPAVVDAAALPQLPHGWAWTTLDSLAQIVGGITKGQKRKSGETLLAVPYLRVANVQRGVLDLSEVKSIEATPQEIEELTLVSGDILFNEGGDRDKLGRGWIWEGQIPQCIHQNHVFRARLVSQQIHPKYISWYANSFGQRYFFDEGKQTTNLASLNMTKLRGLPIPLPPWNEQIRAVEEMDKQLTYLNALESEVQAAAQRAQILRQAVLRDAFSGKLVPQDPNDEPASVLLERIRAERARTQQEKDKDPKATNDASRKNGQRRRCVTAESAVEDDASRTVKQRRRRVAKLAQGVSPGKG